MFKSLILCVFLCHMLNMCLLVWSLGVLNITLESIYRFFIAPLGCKLLPRRAFIMNNSIVHAYFLKTLPHGLLYPSQIHVKNHVLADVMHTIIKG